MGPNLKEKLLRVQSTKIGIAVSSVGLLALLFDAFISDILRTKFIFVLFVGMIFTANILRLTNKKYRSQTSLGIIFNVLIMFVRFYYCLIIGFVFWGFGLFGRDIPFFFFFAFILSFIIGFWSCLEMVIESLKTTTTKSKM